MIQDLFPQPVKVGRRLIGYTERTPEGVIVYDERNCRIPWPAFKSMDHAIEALKGRWGMMFP